MSNVFYVYLLLDPRKYYQPFYVGKGKGDRYKDHLIEHSSTRKGKNYLKNSVIKKIKTANLKIGILKWEENLSEQRAFELEKELIYKFGRRIDGTGILTNLTLGGEGTSGKIFSKKERMRRSQRMSGENNHMYGKTHSPEALKKMSDRFKGKPGTPHSDEHKKRLKERNPGGIELVHH